MPHDKIMFFLTLHISVLLGRAVQSQSPCHNQIDPLPKLFARIPGPQVLPSEWSACCGAAFRPVPTRSKAPLLSLAPRARSAPFVPLCPKVPDLLENQDLWLSFSDDFRALTRLGKQYHPSHYC